MRCHIKLAILAVLLPSLLSGQKAEHEAEQVVANFLRNESVLQTARELLARPVTQSDELFRLITNSLIRAEIDIVPSELDVSKVRDARHVVSTTKLSEFGCILPLPWGMPTRQMVSTNSSGGRFLLLRSKSGVAVTLWDPNSPSEIDVFFNQDIPSAALHLGLDEAVLASPVTLWSRALHASSGDVCSTNSVHRLAETASLLLYKTCVWPFKTETLYEIHDDDYTVFQFGCPEKDRKIILEIFSGGTHTTVYVQTVNDSVSITQSDVLDLIEGFEITTEARITIHIDKAGRTSVHKPVTNKELAGLLQGRFNRHGDFPILIRAEDETAHRVVRRVIDTCLAIGHKRIQVSDGSDPPLDWRSASRDAAVPSPDLPPNGIHVSDPDPIVITCAQDSMHGDLIKALRACKKSGLTNVVINSVWRNASVGRRPASGSSGAPPGE